MKCFHDAGVPKGVLNLVFGVPSEVSEHLIGSDIVKNLESSLIDFDTLVGNPVVEASDEVPRKVSGKAAYGTVSKPKAYRKTLLVTLYENDDEMTPKECAAKVIETMKAQGKLTATDLQHYDDNPKRQTRAEHKINFCREELVQEGLILHEQNGGRRGYWKLSAEGIKEAKRLVRAGFASRK